MSKQVKQFHQLITQNPALVEKLKKAPDRKGFIKLIVQLGTEYGYSFTNREVEVYIAQNIFTLMKQFS